MLPSSPPRPVRAAWVPLRSALRAQKEERTRDKSREVYRLAGPDGGATSAVVLTYYEERDEARPSPDIPPPKAGAPRLGSAPRITLEARRAGSCPRQPAAHDRQRASRSD